jgi:hypothetical protein
MSAPLAFNIDIAAERLGVKRRWLQDWLRSHPQDVYGVPFYRLAGKTKLFTQSDLHRILGALPTPRLVPPCSSSIRRGQVTRRGRFAANTSESVLSEALALASGKLPPISSPSGKKKSNAAPMPGQKTLPSPVQL